jgi:hypothetical protein
MRAIRFGGECPASIVAKKRQLRKRAEEVDVQVNFFTTGSTEEHRGAQGKSAQGKADSPRVFTVSLCSLW